MAASATFTAALAALAQAFHDKGAAEIKAATDPLTAQIATLTAQLAAEHAAAATVAS